MSSNAVTLSQIKAGRVQEQIVLRLLRFWSARNVKRGGQVMGIDLLFVDRESTLAHATMNVFHTKTFQPLLRDGAVYVLSNFDAGRSSPRYRLSDFHLSLRFNDSTLLVQVSEPEPQIPKQVYRFRSYAELETLAVSNTDLPDIMGQVSSTKAFQDGVTNDLRRIMLSLTMQSGHEVRLTAFDDQALLLSNHLKNKQSEFCVILATNINPRKFAGKLYANTTGGTRFFFNDEVQATLECMESFRNSSSLARYSDVQKIEHISIAELNSFILTADSQDIEYLCTCKVVGIHNRRGWTFLACSVCGRKMNREGSSLWCSKCRDQPTVGDVRYRVELEVEDGSAKAVFVVFDNEMQKLTSIEASSLASQMGDDEPQDDGPVVIPEVISSLIGSTFTFQLRLSEFNFGPYHESFGVSRVFKDARDVPKPSFQTSDPSASSGSKTDHSAGTKNQADHVDGRNNLASPEAVVLSKKNKKQKMG